MKNLFKIAFAVVAFAAVGLGSYKAYGSYTAANMSEEDLLIAENVLALSEDIKVTYVKVKDKSGNCYKKTVLGTERKEENEIHYIRYHYKYDLDTSGWITCITVPCLGGGCHDECTEVSCPEGASMEEGDEYSEWIMVL